MSGARQLCLTFDVEEFDLPDDLGVRLEPAARRRVERVGGQALVELARAAGPFTCFVTAAYARADPAVVQGLAAAGCEIACHGLEHGDRYADLSPPALVSRLTRARRELEGICGQRVVGHRGPRFALASEAVLLQAGFTYDSSIHPTYVPGRYNHLRRPTSPTRGPGGLWQVPVSVLPGLRLPLSWIWFRHTPGPVLRLAVTALALGPSPICLYFHAWELCDLRGAAPEIPWAVRRGTGPALAARLQRLCQRLERRGYERATVRSATA